MKRKKLLAVLLTLIMLFALTSAPSLAATKQPTGEEGLETLELCYMEYIKARSEYCDAVWNEIQQTYKEGRAFYIKEGNAVAYSTEYTTALEYLGELTWVKSSADLKEVKRRYLEKINQEYENHHKTDYNEYNWDYIEDGLYIGKKMVNKAETFTAAAMGYYEAMNAMECATTKSELQEIKTTHIDDLSRLVNLYLDANAYSAPVWTEIEKLYQEGVAAIKKAEQAYQIEMLSEEYTEKICSLSGLTYPLNYVEIEDIIEEIQQPALDFYDAMTSGEYTLERLWEAEDIVWILEDAIYEATDRTAAAKLVSDALKELKALPTRAEDIKLYKEYVVRVKAVGHSGTSIKVRWNTNKELDGYVIYRASSKNGSYKEIKRFDSGETGAYTDKKLTYGKKYYYKVKGIKGIDFEEKYTKLSQAAMGTPKLVAPAVTLKKAGTQAVKLTWKQVPGADGYQIYRATSVNGQFKLVKTIKKGSTLTWRDTSTVKGKTYYYKMRAYDIKKDKTKKYSVYGAIKSIKR